VAAHTAVLAGKVHRARSQENKALRGAPVERQVHHALLVNELAVGGGAGHDELRIRLPVDAPGYLAELRFSGIYLLDGNSGGACGRTVRVVFAR
jgi:hypothetical protein